MSCLEAGTKSVFPPPDESPRGRRLSSLSTCCSTSKSSKLTCSDIKIESLKKEDFRCCPGELI